MTPPKDVAGVRRFLGTVNYFAKYVSKISELSEPLRLLTSEKMEWQWDHEQNDAFKRLKRALTTAPLLGFFDNSCENTTVQCDASQKALGAVLMQNGRPICFGSRTLSKAEVNYAQIEKELLAVVFAMERFDHYTFGRHVTVESDHCPLQIIMKKPVVSAPKRLQRMLLRLQRYDFDLIYTPGRQLLVADTLSRAPVQNCGGHHEQSDLETVCAITESQSTDPMMSSVRTIITESDLTLTKVKKLIKEGWPTEKKGLPPDVIPYFHVRDELTCDYGIIFKGNRCVIPLAMRKDMLQELHRAHLGLEATLRRARETVYWPMLTAELKAFIRRCDTCRTMDPQQQKEPMINHDVINQVWAKVGVDLFQFEGRDYLVTVEYLTNFWEVDYLRNDTTSRNVIRKLKMNFARYGIPMTLVSDNGPQFASQEFRKFVDCWGIEHVLTSPYHPRSNGKAESAVKTAKTLMAKAAHSGSDLFLMLLEYRNTPTQSLDSSPAQQMICRAIRSRLPSNPSTLQQNPVPIERLGHKMEQAQTRQREAYNRGSKELPALHQGQHVRIMMRGLWTPAVVQRADGPRSYVIKTIKGSYFRRNRRGIRASPFLFSMGESEYGVGDDGIGDAEAEAEKDSAMANQEGNDCDKEQGQGPGLPDQCEPENIVRTRYGSCQEAR